MKLGWSMTVERRSETSKQRTTIGKSETCRAPYGQSPRRSDGSDESLGGTAKRLPGIAAREPSGLVFLSTRD